MNSYLNVYLAAFATALATTFLTLPVWRAWCLRVGLVDDPGHRKIHDAAMPLAGGLAVLTGLLIPLMVGIVLLKTNLIRSSHTGELLYGLDRRKLQLAAIIIGAAAMTILGVLDDKHELRPMHKFIGQFLIAALVAAAGIRITLFVHSVIFSYVITILWLVTMINAFNFMDNMNGLCAGLGAIGAGWFALLAARNGHFLVGLMAFLICGALIGFLPHNFPRARAFLGDAGSHLVGFLLAVLAILPHFYSKRDPRHWLVIAPLLVLTVPLADLAWVVILRTRAGKPFYIGDTNHLSHRLVRLGLSKVAAVLLIWIIALLAGSVVLL